MVMTEIVQGIKAIPTIPGVGEIYISVNLALADPGTIWQLAKEQGFNPQIVYLTYRTGIEIHALLHYEQRPKGSVMGYEFEDRLDALEEGGIDSDAIRVVYGGPQEIAA
jgi:hypothetical protein